MGYPRVAPLESPVWFIIRESEDPDFKEAWGWDRKEPEDPLEKEDWVPFIVCGSAGRGVAAFFASKKEAERKLIMLTVAYPEDTLLVKPVKKVMLTRAKRYTCH